MQVIAYKTRALIPPQDSLREAVRASIQTLKEGDIVALSSKVVSIDEGRCVPMEKVDKQKLITTQADWYYRAPKTSKWRRVFTIAKGALVGSAGIDESNGSGHYILYPENPFKSARTWRTWLRKEYGIDKIGVIITDSTSMPLRRGAIGFALSWDGFDPLRDYRGTKDIFGRTIEIEMANIADALAAAAVVEMGEGAEETPIAVIRDAKNIAFKKRAKHLDQLLVEPEDDLFAPLVWRKGWKQGRN